MWAGRVPASTGNWHIKLRDSAIVLSVPLSVFSGVVFGVDGLVSDAGPARFCFVP